MNCAVYRLLTIGLATAAAFVAWFLFTTAAGLDLPVGPLAVLLVAAGAGFAGWGLLALLERLSATRARPIWILVASAVLALSLLGPLGAGAGSAVLGLLSLHLVVGLALIAGLPRPR